MQLTENFCIIESRDAVKVATIATIVAASQCSSHGSVDSTQDFANLQLEEITSNIQARRNKIFLLMEEVRRLRIQQRLKARRALSCGCT